MLRPRLVYLKTTNSGSITDGAATFVLVVGISADIEGKFGFLETFTDLT